MGYFWLRGYSISTISEVTDFHYLHAALCAIYANMPLSFPSTICCIVLMSALSKLIPFQGFSELFQFFSKHHFDLIFILFILFPMLLITYKSFCFGGIHLFIYLFIYGHTFLLSRWFPVCCLVCSLSVFRPRVISAAAVDRRRAETWRGGWEAVCLLIESCHLRRWRGVKDDAGL